MPKLKITDDELDIDELEDAEYTEGDYESYGGDQPPKGTILAGHVKKMWWTYTRNEDPMLKVLFVADGNTGDEEQYNGLPIWENAPLMASTKFRWKPLIDCLGITLKDVKTKTVVASDDDNMGAPIERIGSFEPGEDALCRVVTGRERYQGEWNTKVGKWLSADEPEDEDDEDEPEPEPQKPARRTRAVTETKTPATRGRRKAAEPEPEDEEDEPEPEDEEDEAEAPPPARSRRTATPARTAKAPAKARATGRRTRAATEEEDEDEPPF